jgi:hypothetical protein
LRRFHEDQHPDGGGASKPGPLLRCNVPRMRARIFRLYQGSWLSVGVVRSWQGVQALDSFYQKLSPGGFTIIDDYNQPHCRMAVTDFRARHGSTEQIVQIDERGVFSRKSSVS